ncbi:MAG: PIG-L deacetylase family protein [Acidimicrobiales bacterium]
MSMTGERVLVLAPHTDDAELGSGGTIARWAAEGADIRIVAFSAAEASVPEGLPADINRTDAVSAAALLGIDAERVEVLDLPVRNFPEHRQRILDLIIRLRAAIEPTIVIGPCSTDRHQDHEVIHQEMMRAFARVTVLGYELPWNMTTFSSTVHIEIGDEDLEAKAASLAAYRSQAHRSYLSGEYLRSWAVTRGIQCGKDLAEGFELMHWTVGR